MGRKQLILLYAISVAAVFACFFAEPIPQDQNYHHFADAKSFFSIPNFWNVISNLPFVVVGTIGLAKLKHANGYPLKPNYVWFFIGILLTGLGSGYYHLQPGNNTLVWDRLPMTVTFMSFLSIIIGEFISVKSGKKLLYPLLAVGLLSIVNWIVTDDLRMYALVQFLPIILILAVLFLSKKQPYHKKYFWLMVVCYTIAKFLESYDFLVYDALVKTVSGHTLKHIAAAAAPFLFCKFADAKFNTKPNAAEPKHA